MFKRIQDTSIVIFLLFINCIHFNACQSNTESCVDIACTLDFRTEAVIIKDQNQNPVALDSFQVFNLENNQNMTIYLLGQELDLARQEGTYPLVNDLSLDINEIVEIQFRGFIGANQIVTENYTASSDCCHVGIATGNQEVIVD